ncbi:MAG: coenzyme F420-0:L-glutamate ligase [Candidatus Thorarchaeota archaeon]
MSPETIRAFPLTYFPLVEPLDNLTKLILEAVENSERDLDNGDILVIASKIVSVSENRIVRAENIEPSMRAREIALENGFDPIHVELALQESSEMIRTKGVLITETHSGLVCNFSGIDKSNAPEGSYILLPENPDVSAHHLRNALMKATGKKLAVIISDTQGRPWRKGSVNLAIGCAGIAPFKYNKGKRDLYSRILKRSTVCQVDEIAMLAEPLMGQAGQRTPVVIVRGYSYMDSEEKARDINRPKHEDMFR